MSNVATPFCVTAVRTVPSGSVSWTGILSRPSVGSGVPLPFTSMYTVTTTLTLDITGVDVGSGVRVGWMIGVTPRGGTPPVSRYESNRLRLAQKLSTYLRPPGQLTCGPTCAQSTGAPACLVDLIALARQVWPLWYDSS